MKFQPPKPRELELQAAKIGLPPIEAQKFFNYYESNGWRVGRNKMRQWRCAMNNWKIHWEERRQFQDQLSPSAAAILRQNELKHVENMMRSIANSYSEHQSWSVEDHAKWDKLKARKVELKKLLGMQV